MTRTVFVAGTGTDIGKTYLTAALVRRLRADGCAVRALKPIASGVPPIDDPAFADSDTARLLDAQGMSVTPDAVAACSPWRFAAPLSPDQAARIEGGGPALADLVRFCRAAIEEGPDLLLIEGVGGLMSPVTEGATGLDLLTELACPAILVAGSHLGGISHALTAVETCRARAVPLVGIVVNESAGAPAPPETVAEAIRRHAAVPVIVSHRDAPCSEALAALF